MATQVNGEVQPITLQMLKMFVDTVPSFNVHAHEVAALSIPVSLDNGDVIIPESEINGLYLPETLTTARDGFATTEVYNYSDSTVTVEFRQPLNVIDFSEKVKQNFHIFHMENVVGIQNFETSKSKPISHIIRTEHLNLEEKDALIKLCREFQDIFHQESDKLSFTNIVKHEIKTTDELPVTLKLIDTHCA
nr:unnamed protein product [Callosobruchus analis]